MDASFAEPHVERFVLALLETGSFLSGLASNLTDLLPADAYPGEEPAAVIVEMLCGTIASALAAADPEEVRRATELIELGRDRTIEHMRLACDLSRRIHRRDGLAYG